MALDVVSISGIDFHKLAISDAYGNPMADEEIDEEELAETGGDIVQNNTEVKQHRKRAGWMGVVVKQLSSWLTTHNETTLERVLSSPDFGAENLEDEELWTEWEWIVSETEKAAARWSEVEADRVRDELALLRKNANFLKSRPICLAMARDAILNKQFSSEELELLETRELDANKRSKIVSDVITAFAEGWLERVMELFFEGHVDEKAQYRDAYYEAAYNKGVVGGLKEVAWQASHGPGGSGLTPHVLGDILWTIWKALISSIRYALHTDLDPDATRALLDAIAGSKDSIIDLWYCTVRNSVFGADREGVLPSKWADQDRQERQRLDEIKRRGADARYEHKPYGSRRRPSLLEQPLIERQQLNDLKRMLENSLHFYVIEN